MSLRLVSSLYGISKSTVADVWKARKKLSITFQPVITRNLLSKKRCIVKEANFEKLDKDS